jgi:hypothetical protein
LHAYAPATCAYPLLHQQNSCDALPDTDVAFAWHDLHDDAPAPENVLLGQVTHALAALAPDIPEYVPALQFAHVVNVVAPVSPEYVPVMQLTLALAPAVVEYDPAGQLVHTVDELAPTVTEYVPALQLTHALAPAVLEYVPALQLTHALALLAPAVAEYAPAVQLRHTLALLAPVVIEYAPAVQFVHDEFPVIVLNLPATHVVQTPPSGPVYPELHLQSEIDLVFVSNALKVSIGHDAHDEDAELIYISLNLIN